MLASRGILPRCSRATMHQRTRGDEESQVASCAVRRFRAVARDVLRRASYLHGNHRVGRCQWRFVEDGKVVTCDAHASFLAPRACHGAMRADARDGRAKKFL